MNFEVPDPLCWAPVLLFQALRGAGTGLKGAGNSDMLLKKLREAQL